MTNNADTVGKLFEHAIELEKATETLYRHLGRMFSHLPEVEAFWRHYADEERGHASYLERIRKGVAVDRLSRRADDSMLEKVRQCLAKASESRIEGIQNLEDAFELATELENSETNAIFEFMIVNFSTDELARSHQFLRTQLSTHIAELENEFPNPYKSRIARQNVLAVK